MFTVSVPLPPQRFDPDAPLKLAELGIDRSDHWMASCIDQHSHFSEQGLKGKTGSVMLQFEKV